MSLSSALSVALSGLQVATSQLQLTANNISNAQTAGYTEKSADLSSVVFGSGDGGVTITGYTRTTNTALSTSYNNATSQASFYSTTNNYLTQVQSLLGSNATDPALSTALANFQSAWTQYSAAPESSTQQNSVIQSGVALAGQIQSLASGVTDLTKSATSDINTTVSTLNSDIANIASLNAQIYAAQSVGAPTGDIQDARDQAVNQVAAITGVTTLQRDNGQIALYTPGGLLLLDGSSAQQFSYNGSTITSGSGQDVTTALTGGSLQAEVNFVSGSPSSSDPGTGVIGKLNAQLQLLTNAFTNTTDPTTSFASAYNNATTGTGELASSFFTTDLAGDPSTFAVNSALTNGTSTLKVASGNAVSTALTATRNFSTSGLTANNNTYTDLGTAILSGFQQAANIVQTQSTSATQQQSFYQTSLSNATGVNVDSELVNLTTLQNSYAASAHVITTINAMLADLENVI